MERYVFILFISLSCLFPASILAYELDSNDDGYIDDSLLPPSISRDSERLALPRARGKAWNILEEYDKGDVATDPDTGNVYVSLVNANTGNTFASTESWQEIVGTNGGASSFADLEGEPADNPALNTALTGKQNRISTQCAGTQKMVGVLLDGTPICSDDEIGAAGTGDITDVVAGTRMAGGGTAGSVTVGVDAATDAEITANTAKASFDENSSAKLATIAENATANSTDAYLLDLANHTGVVTPAQVAALTTDDISDDAADHRFVTLDMINKLAGIQEGATGDQTGGEISYLLFQELDTNNFTNTYRDYVLANNDKISFDATSSTKLAGLNPGTDPGDIVQLGAACTVGDGAYTDQTTCETNNGEWVGVLSIICDADTEDCDTKLDLLSAAEIDDRIAAGVGSSTAGGYEIDGGDALATTFTGTIDGGSSI